MLNIKFSLRALDGITLVMYLQTSETTSNMASVEEDFPRGGTTKKSTESKIVAERTEVDNLFQVEFSFFPSVCPAEIYWSLEKQKKMIHMPYYIVL